MVYLFYTTYICIDLAADITRYFILKFGKGGINKCSGCYNFDVVHALTLFTGSYRLIACVLKYID